MDATPYYAPTYFPASYFYGPDDSAASTGPLLYFAPTYFPAAYFYSSAIPPITPSPTPVPVLTPVGRDAPSFESILGLLRSTGAFEEVIYGGPIQASQPGADGYPLAVVSPKGWEESDDFDPTLIVRRVTFTITIVVKSQESTLPFAVLDQLTAVVQGAIDRSDLDGTCLAALTKIRSGRYGESPRYPEQSIELEGGFASLYDPSTNTTPTT